MEHAVKEANYPNNISSGAAWSGNEPYILGREERSVLEHSPGAIFVIFLWNAWQAIAYSGQKAPAMFSSL